jgi:hypothetical protein
VLSNTKEGLLDYFSGVCLDVGSYINEERLESLCISIYGSLFFRPWILLGSTGPTLILALVPFTGVPGSAVRL